MARVWDCMAYLEDSLYLISFFQFRDRVDTLGCNWLGASAVHRRRPAFSVVKISFHLHLCGACSVSELFLRMYKN
jgi:hypothetical protein